MKGVPKMKKFSLLFLLMIILGTTGIATAGPIDWCLSQVGYTPTARYSESAQALHEANSVLAAKNQLILVLRDSIQHLQSLSSSTTFLAIVFGLLLALIAGYKAGMIGLYQKMREKLKKPVEKPMEVTPESI